MSRNLEGVHVGFLSQITGQKANRQRDRNFRSKAAATVIKEAGTQYLGSYINKRQATVTEWVVSRQTLKVCNKEKGCEGGGRRQEPW